MLDTDQHDGERGRQGDDELVGAQFEDLAHPGDVDELDPDQEHDRGEYGVGHVLQWFGEEQQDDDDAWHRWSLGRARCDPPAPSTIWVFVGLPLTTNVPENPAATLAKPRPTRSVFSLNASLYFAAYARDVAAL